MIKKLTLQNVAAIADFSNPVDFPNLTVVLGKNDVCKTTLLKMLYTLCKTAEQYSLKMAHDANVQLEPLLSDKLCGVYGRNKMQLGDLVRKNGSPKRLSVHAEFSNSCFQTLDFSYGVDSKRTIKDVTISAGTNEQKTVLFIPAKEVVTAFSAIKAISKKYYYPGYDDATLDLIEQLDLPETLLANESFVNAIVTLKEMFGGELKQQEKPDRFVFKRENVEYSMQMTAEGVKHIGVLGTLIKNNQLQVGSILCMDEPEDNLHPFAIRQLAKIIFGLSEVGVQVFLTTHNYFLIKQLQMLAEYNQKDVMCCSLVRKGNRTVETEFANLRDGMPDNDIIRESIAMYDEDIEMSINQ